MPKRIFIRIISAMLVLCMILPVSGCNSLFLKVATNIADTPEEQTSSNYAWPVQGERRVEIKNTYKSSGMDAFYIDEQKCLKDEIEEFHLITLGYNFTVYYYTAASNPSFKGATGTGYYCLAVYGFYTKTYRVLADGFYNKAKGNASFAFKKEPSRDYAFACLGDTFMDLYVGTESGAKIFRTFTLSDFDKLSIKRAVGGDYVCTDIAYIDYGADRIAAVFMYAADSETDEIRFVEYDIDFDTSKEDPVHYIEYMNKGIIETDSIVTSSGPYPTYGTVFTYDYSERAKKLELFRNSPFVDTKTARSADVGLYCKTRDENLVSLSLREYEGSFYLYLLFAERLQVYRIDVDEKDNFSYTNLGAFALDKSDSYATFDVTPSIVMASTEKIYGCSLNQGFFAQSIDGSPTKIKDGAYYAAYQIYDEPRYYVIGFDDKTHKRTTTNYVGDMVVSSSSENVAYTMNDLPFAKIHTIAIPYHLQ